MTPPQLVLAVLVAAWIGSELAYNRKRAGAAGDRRRDQGTLRVLHLGIGAAVAVAVGQSLQAGGSFAPGVRAPLFWSGCALMAAGLVLRAWSVRVLAHYFTVNLAIRDGHRLVRSGPYRLLRHPSYTGALATFLGFALALGNAWSLAVIAVVVTAAFLWRIRVEEALLRDAFPEAWPAYARQTWRLLPYLW